jgi:hypothetical protein
MEQRILDQALIRKYLLGDISNEEQEGIEQRLLVDEDFTEELSMTRTEMVDDYVAGNLSAKEKQEFENHFLSTPEHVRIVEIGKALNNRLEDQSRDSAIRNSPALPRYRIRSLNVIISLTACAILAVAAYFVWDLVRDRQPNNNPANEAQKQRRILENELVKLNRPATSAQTSFAVVSLNLKPILVRDIGENRSVVIPRNPSIVRLRLELPVVKYQTYATSLQTDDGVDLGAIDGLMASTLNNGKVVVLDLPSWLIRPGSFQIKLTGVLPSGQSEDITRYPFELTNQ